MPGLDWIWLKFGTGLRVYVRGVSHGVYIPGQDVQYGNRSNICEYRERRQGF